MARLERVMTLWAEPSVSCLARDIWMSAPRIRAKLFLSSMRGGLLLGLITFWPAQSEKPLGRNLVGIAGILRNAAGPLLTLSAESAQRVKNRIRPLAP